MKTMKFADFFCLLAVMLFLAGCATNQVRVIYYSDPPGATLYEGQRAVGYTPFTLIYNILPEAKNEKSLNVQGAKVIWASGVSTSVDHLILDRGKGSYFHFTFSRPDVPGRELDVNFALQL